MPSGDLSSSMNNKYWSNDSSGSDGHQFALIEIWELFQEQHHYVIEQFYILSAACIRCVVNLLHSEELCRSCPRFVLSSNMTSCPGYEMLLNWKAKELRKLCGGDWDALARADVSGNSQKWCWNFKNKILSSSSHGLFQSSDSIRHGDRKRSRSQQLQMDLKERFIGIEG